MLQNTYFPKGSTHVHTLPSRLICICFVAKPFLQTQKNMIAETIAPRGTILYKDGVSTDKILEGYPVFKQFVSQILNLTDSVLQIVIIHAFVKAYRKGFQISLFLAK
jgi:hypothetical protein